MSYIAPQELATFLQAAYFGSRIVERAEQFSYRTISSRQEFLTTFALLREQPEELQNHPATVWARSVMSALLGEERDLPGSGVASSSLRSAINMMRGVTIESTGLQDPTQL